ncbi:MAG: cell surface protein SprA [Tannerella sp.]|jgi:cell surface protein SprA|nr:cell surface protein SprA [Tannerella sp.]
MKRGIKYIITVIACLSGIFAPNAGYAVFQAETAKTQMRNPSAPETTLPDTAAPNVSSPEQLMPDDTIVKPRIPVKKTVPEEYDDLNKNSASDLRDPENLKTEVEYDLKSGTYLIRSKVGDMNLVTPLQMTPEEYQKYSLEQSLKRYFYERNRAVFDSLGVDGKGAADRFNLMDMQFDIGGADKLFGPGGVRLRSQGMLGLDIGLKTSKTKNPSLPEKSRSHTFFNFNTDVQMNMRASVGTKINFGMDYNTDAAFDYDATKLKLAYGGEEDEIVKSLEGGNVSMNTNNSLIRGGAALFGVKTDLQFGKLRVKALIAQQESDSRSISSKGNLQMTDFELPVDKYDENRHYFLAHYFRDTYDKALSKLPYISSAVSINRIEVWITNKSSNYGQARNIVAFSDLGEHKHISNPLFTPSGSNDIPYNETNTLYRTIVDNYPGARNVSSVTQTFAGFIEGGRDYEKIESARLLSSSEYILNTQLGYISLNTHLQADEVLAVAFEYTYNGVVYQVGEFSSDNNENTNKCLFLKLLKATSLSPDMPVWDLMMKNIYYINARSIQKQKFRLDIVYQSDTAGTYVYTIPEGNIKSRTLLKVMNLDRLNTNNEVISNGETEGDGFFDFVEGFTITAGYGLIIFPVVEPFGAHLREKIGDDKIADKYVYEELYDSTLTVARQIAEKNKFLIRGQYSGSSSNNIPLGATNVARGSVIVKANGLILTENVDYIVNYASGTVTILNENLLSGNSAISVSLENQSTSGMQRKTMFGTDLNYEFSKNFNIGATVMHLSEMPLTTKTAFGDESVKNTLLGVNTDYKGQSQWLTNMFDKLPLLSLTQPSTFSVNSEFAYLIANHYQNKYTGEFSYLDDFESTQSEFDLLNPYFWNLASTPSDDNKTTAMFPEASLANNVEYGKNRALMAWYYIDGLFTRRNSSLRPSYMSDEDLSNHHVRAVQTRELFPNRDQVYNENSYLNVLNLAYYPNERGPYNLDADNINDNGTLMNPEKRWGGIMRNLDQSDFETANIQYIEFWIMDPFIYNPDHKGGDLYFNLGEISEDILKDEKKFFENGLPVNDDDRQVDTTVWGKIPKQQSTVYAFDNSAGSRIRQDVGFNGISSAEEKSGAFSAYAEYLNKLLNKLPQETILKMQDDPLSPLNDPAGDDYRYFRGSDYDREQSDILTRYKHYNGVEGNSRESGDSPETYDTSSKMIPDAEDFNQDNTLNENEKYYQYKVSVRPGDMNVGSNFIVDKRIANVRLANGTREDVTWYQFKIPIREYNQKVGSINDFSSIRFMRTFMTGFSETTILRFGAFSLVRGEWRPYRQALYKSGVIPSVTGSLSVSTVNIEENGDREPIRYMLPPGVTRITDPSQPQLRQQNEQSLSLKVTGLASQDARAVYKTTSYDLRRYKRIQMFAHAEKLVDDITDLQDGDLSVFIRLGTDYKNNYYEYEAPLNLTPFGSISSNEVWPDENILNIQTNALTDLKLSRNRAKSNPESGVSYHTVYSEYDPNNRRNTMSIVGNPTLSDVQVIMIGVRNNSKNIKSAEVWVNELRITDFDESGGWAANTNMNLNISDFATINASGNIETAGFGGLEQSVTERSMDDYSQFSITTTVQLGKLFPEKTKVSLPLYYAYSKEVIAPQYNPLDQDILLKESINNEATVAGKDSIRNFANDVLTTKAFALNNVKINIRSETPMPYDPANFSLGYASNVETKTNPETAYETTKNYQGNLGYTYTPYIKPFKPFEKIKAKGGATRYLNQLAFAYLPESFNIQNFMTRNYYEIQLRDLNDLNNASSIPVSFSQNFLWDRSFEIRWKILTNFLLDFTSSTNARIEEPYVQVNKALNPDQYQMWKDSVKKSIAELGTPLLYDQTFTATYTLPFQYISATDWMTGNFNYRAQYNWEKGAFVDKETIIGNTIKNERVIEITGALNLLSLYNKNEFLKKVIQKSNINRTTPPKKTAAETRRKTLEMDVTLSPDSGIIVQHNMLTTKVLINARLKDDSTKRYKVSYKAIDYARIRITNRDSVSLKLSIRPAPSKDETFTYKLVEHSARTLIMIRRIDVSYSLTDGMYIPGFMPGIGSWLGQGPSAAGRAPGWGFAFGDVRRSYIDEAAEKGWFIYNQGNITPAMINSAKMLTGKALIEPLPGFKINLNANYLDSRDTEIQFMFKGMPETKGGNFTMTTIGLGGFFSGAGNANKGYNSGVFQKMLNNRNIIVSRINGSYEGSRYPDAGFLAGTSYPSRENGFDPKYGSTGINSGDVLIPSFIAAYTNRRPEKVGLTAFPSLKNLLPNWNITYDGLIRIPSINRHFRNMTLSHRYTGVYNIGGYTSYLNWVNAGIGGDLGYVRDTESGAPIPSMGYEIASVTLTENFNPLFGIDATFLNNITAGSKYSKSRTINLNVTSYQMVEAFTDDITVSLGYKYAEFNKILKLKKKGDFSNDLTVRLDYTYRKALSLIRKFEDGYTQATQGNISHMMQFSADYAFSKKVTLRAFYDLQVNEPLVSSSSFPTSNSNYGISIQISLNNE